MSHVVGQLKAVAIGSFVSIALFFSGLLTFVTPLPILYVYLVKGRIAGAMSAAVALTGVVAAYFFFMPQFAATEGALSYFLMPGQGFYGYLPSELIRLGGTGYFVFFAAVGIALAEGARRKWDVLKWGGVALIAGICVLAALAVLSLHFGVDQTLGGIRSYLLNVFGEVARVSEESGEVSTQVAFLTDRAADVADIFIRVLPGLVFAIAVLTVAINLIVSRRIVRGKHSFAHVHNIARFRVPDVLIWGVIVSGVAFFLDAYAVKSIWLRGIGLNGLIALGSLYFLQGMAVIVYFVQGIKAPLIRTLAYAAMIIFLQTVSLGLLVVGVADVWANFRLRRWRTIHHHSQ